MSARDSASEITHQLLRRTAQESYGRLLSAIIRVTGGDIASAEDVLSEAFARAAEHWPRDGTPTVPEAWLTQTAKRAWIDRVRQARTAERHEPELTSWFESVSEQREEQLIIDARSDARSTRAEAASDLDERLPLLYLCAHPAIDPATRAPLMLQTLFGLDAQTIADRFLVSAAAMSKRLVRAKQKIRIARIPFVLPNPFEHRERLTDVLDAIYAVYTVAWERPERVAQAASPASADEALALARLTAKLEPKSAEALGLLSLILHASARRAARQSEGRFVPLAEQDTTLWNREQIDEAEAHLRRAQALEQIGRYQLEAALQSAHVHARLGGSVELRTFELLYDALLKVAPSVGARLDFASCLLGLGVPERAQQILSSLDPEQVATHQPYWVVRAELALTQGRTPQAILDFERALELTPEPGMQTYLRTRLEVVTASSQRELIARCPTPKHG